MKTAMKKLFSLMLVAVLLIGVMPFQAFADGSTAILRVFIGADYTDKTIPAEQHYSASTLLGMGYSGAVDGYTLMVGYGGADVAYQDGIYVPADQYVLLYVTPKAATCTYPDCGSTEHTAEAHCAYEGCGQLDHDATAHCGTCGQLGHNADAHCPECGNVECTCCPECDKAECICCDTCNKYPCECKASVEILVKVDNADGYDTEGTFQLGAGVKSATAIFNAAGYNKNTVLSYSVTDGNGANKVVLDETIELTAGGSYILWLEVAPATKPVVSPASVNVLAKEPEAEGYTDIKTFTMPAGSQSVTDIFKKAAYSGTVLSYSITAEDGSNKRIPGDDIELTAGGSYILWLEVAPATQPAPDQNVAKYDVRVNLNYDRKMGDTIEDVAKGTRMSEVLEHVHTPYRWGYKFAGWYWDDDCRDRDAVKLSDKVTKDCTIYAKWVKKHAHNEVMLKIYINGDTHNVAKIVDLHEYAKDGWISKDEVKAVVKQYYTAKDSDGLTFYGLFDAENWKSFVRNKNHDGSKHIEVNQGYDTTVYVMVHNAKTYATSSSTADATNPKTGDTIGMAITMMAVAAAALAAVYVTSKKRAV